MRRTLAASSASTILSATLAISNLPSCVVYEVAPQSLLDSPRCGSNDPVAIRRRPPSPQRVSQIDAFRDIGCPPFGGAGQNGECISMTCTRIAQAPLLGTMTSSLLIVSILGFVIVSYIALR